LGKNNDNKKQKKAKKKKPRVDTTAPKSKKPVSVNDNAGT
jgi:hypothetical protein